MASKRKKPAPRKPAPRKPAATKRKASLSPAIRKALKAGEIDGVVHRLSPPVQLIVETLRKLVLDAAPEASERLADGAPAYFAKGMFARIEPQERAVLLRFMHGAQLPSAAALKGDQISVTSVKAVSNAVLKKLVREAVLLNTARRAD